MRSKISRMSANTPASSPNTPETAKVSNFLRQIIEKDLEQGTYAHRKWAGSPGDAAHHAEGQPGPPRSAPVFRPSPMATCISATPRASA